MSFNHVPRPRLTAFTMATDNLDPAQPITFAQLANKWVEANSPRLRAKPLAEMIRLLNVEVPAELAHRPADSITRKQWHALFSSQASRPGIRRVTHAHVRRIYRWGMSECLCELDPTLGLKSPVPRARTRMLTDDELRTIWHAVDALPSFDGHSLNDYARCIRMLMATGCRRGEIGGLSWDEVKLDYEGGPVLDIPAERFKSNVPHIVPINALAAAQLPAPRPGRDHVFGFGIGTAAEPGGFDGFGKYKQILNAQLGPAFPPFVVHDLRRVVRSKMAALRVPADVAELCIGHGKQGMRRVYDLHHYLPEMRLAFELWGRELERIVGMDVPGPGLLRPAPLALPAPA